MLTERVTLTQAHGIGLLEHALEAAFSCFVWMGGSKNMLGRPVPMRASDYGRASSGAR